MSFIVIVKKLNIQHLHAVQQVWSYVIYQMASGSISLAL